ncbi:MAG: DUF3108 domain-containing protein [Myxococcota bacterium]|nr:DUF3108 domain-containing protein [Myxococcota bacterium]
MHGLLVVLLAGCAGVAAAPPPPAPAPVQHLLGAPLAIAGESMVFELTFRGMHAARVQVAVGQPGWVDGRPSIIVKSHGETDGLIALIGGLDWTLATTMDLERGTPLLVVEDAIVTFGGKTETNHERSTDPRHSIHSAVCVLRGWRSKPGQQASLVMRIDRAQLDLQIQESAHEFLDGVGKPAVRYEGVARGKFPFKIWISDDTARVPLRMETSTKWGAVAVELVEYNAPRD